MSRIIRSFVIALTVAAGFAVVCGTASAADYRLLEVVHANPGGGAGLGDKQLRLYENVKETQTGRDGWCFVPGDKANRSSSWSCTVKGTSFPVSNAKIAGVTLKTYRDGSQVNVNGRTVTARKRPPRPGLLPYCAYQGVLADGGPKDYHSYICAYFL